MNECKDRNLWSIQEMRHSYIHRGPTYSPGQGMIIAKSVIEVKLGVEFGGVPQQVSPERLAQLERICLCRV